AAIGEGEQEGGGAEGDDDGGQGQCLRDGICRRPALGADDRGAASPAAGEEQQQVRPMGQERQADDDAAQVALEQQVGACCVEHRHREREGQDDHGPFSVSARASTRAVPTPITTMNTPMSKRRALVMCISPSRGTSRVTLAASRKASPQTQPAMPVANASARPRPMIVAGGAGRDWRARTRPEATSRITRPETTTRPATNPPPGALWPRKRRNSAKTAAV